jgi:hypothetical protein
LSIPVWSPDTTLNNIKAARESDGPKRQWLIITNHLVVELNTQYDKLLQESNNQATVLTDQFTDTQVVVASFRTLALVNARNRSSHTATDYDGTMPYPTPFSGDDKDSTNQIQALHTWRTRIEARWAHRQHKCNTKRAKILYVAALLEGMAADGVNADLEKITSNLENPAA